MEKENKVKFWEQDSDTILYTIMCVVTIPAVLLGFLYLWFAKERLPENVTFCVFQRVLGLYCPGCGGTRAFRALLHGDIFSALYYHPGAVYGALLYVTYFISQTLMRLSRGKLWGMKLKPSYLYFMLA